LSRNPVLLAKAPKLDEKEVEPYGIEEIQRLLGVASERRNSARWALALALGLRQGEALGLRWEDVDLDHGVLRVRRSRLRPRYAHGCDGTCEQAPGLCPQRMNVRQATGEVKSKAGRRTIGLPLQLVALLRGHRPSRSGTASGWGLSGRPRAGCSPARLASRSTRTPITRSGSGCSG